MEVPSGATVRDVLGKLSSMPGGDRLPPRPLVAVNEVYASAGTTLGVDDEVAIIPPVAGG
jgi:molybdopterin synthase sulfur carrier subunit